MNDSIESVISRIRSKRGYGLYYNEETLPSREISPNTSHYLKRLTTRFLIAAIFVLVSVIFTKYSTNNLLMYKKYVLNESFKFTAINNLYQKYLGGILPFDNLLKDNSQTVFNEKLAFKSQEEYHDGLSLNVGASYLVPNITSGIVVFIGDKENYGNTVIIQGMDGVDIWYGNVETANLKLYDYMESGNLIGEAKSDNIYLVLQKDGTYLKYDDYNKEI